MWGGAYWGSIPWAGTLTFGQGAIPGIVVGFDTTLYFVCGPDEGSQVHGYTEDGSTGTMRGGSSSANVCGEDEGSRVEGGDRRTG